MNDASDRWIDSGTLTLRFSLKSDVYPNLIGRPKDMVKYQVSLGKWTSVSAISR